MTLRACLILLVIAPGARAQGRQATPGLRPVRVAQRRPRARPALTQEPSDSEDATCYGRRYPDLAFFFCGRECNVQLLHQHFQDYGRQEGRRFGCEAAPLTAAETARWKVHEARLRAREPVACGQGTRRFLVYQYGARPRPRPVVVRMRSRELQNDL